MSPTMFLIIAALPFLGWQRQSLRREERRLLGEDWALMEIRDGDSALPSPYRIAREVRVTFDVVIVVYALTFAIGIGAKLA